MIINQKMRKEIKAWRGEKRRKGKEGKKKEGRERKGRGEEGRESTVSLQNSACFSDLSVLMDLTSLLNQFWHLLQTFFNRGMKHTHCFYFYF